MKSLLYPVFVAAAALTEASLLAAPSLAITREGSQVKITFTRALESALSLGGPWFALTNVSTSYAEDLSTGSKFFRARESNGLFSDASPLTWVITGPLQTNFNLAYAGTPDGIFPPKRVKEYFDAELKMGALNLPVTMRVRGNSSLQECPFPKLKLKVSKENRAGTPFADAREIKIGTHCAEGGIGNIGRLRDERAAWREALAYETMALLGFVTPRVRRAVVEYHDSGLPDHSNSSGWAVTRHAFIAEDIELVADQLGGRVLDDAEITALRDVPFDPQLVADLELLHALLGNWDFSLDANGRGIWNTDVIELPDKQLLPLAGDFDLASWVTESVRLSAPREYHPELGDVERQALYTLSSIQSAEKERFAESVARFSGHRLDIEAAINSAEIDDAGRKNAVRHVSAFFEGLAMLSGKPGGGKTP